MASLEEINLSTTQDDDDVYLTLESEDDSTDTDENIFTSEEESDEEQVGMENEDIFQWSSDTFHSKIHQFDHCKSGIKLNIPDNISESETVKLFLDTNLITHIVKETNRQFMFCTKNKRLSYRLEKWKDTTIDEIYLFLAIIMLMPRNSRNQTADHWSTDYLFYSPVFGDTMSRNRFQILLRMLHFNNNEHQPPNDRVYKIRPIFQMLKTKFSGYFYPYEKLYIDESLSSFRGCLCFRQFSKTTRFGIKLFVICDCKSGYILNFITHSGTTAEFIHEEKLGISGNVVMTLIEPYLNRGHTLYVDNWYTSPILFQGLHSKKTNACEIVKKNRQYYNKNMDKIDRSDMMVSFVTIMQKSMPWYKKIFFHLLDMVLFNAHTIYKEKKGSNVSLGDFQIQVIKQLIENHNLPPSKKRKHCPDTPQNREVQGDHFFGEYEPTAGKKSTWKRCTVCIKKKQRKETKYFCKHCNVPLCVVPCFELYHTSKKYV